MALLDKAENIANQFAFTDDDAQRCCTHFTSELATSMKMADENGLSLAVDLGGTNLRVCSVDLHGDSTYTAQHARITIPPDMMTAPKASDLFMFIAEQIKHFLEAYHAELLSPDQGKKVELLSLGFTFSYPAYQNSINSGILLRWTKGFDIPDAVGKDVCQLLQNAVDELHLPVRITALVNDALGALMFRAYILPLSETRTTVGAIFGTGTNGVYLEKLSNITKDLEGSYPSGATNMFVSCEWGSFDNGLLVQPNTKYDTALDQVSVNRGNQMFEKRVSGMFLGELLRIILVELYEDPVVRLFRGEEQAQEADLKKDIPFFTRWAVDTSILSVAEADNSEQLLALKQKISDALSIPSTSVRQAEARAVKLIANAIGKRAARLAGTALAAVILRGRQSSTDVQSASADADSDQADGALVDVAVDGSVVEHYPGFEAYMREVWNTINGIGPDIQRKVKIGIAKDGSSIGSAIIALVAAR
ncbi:glucokinase [Phaeosphaeriaceae sp. PMI808]|nr:glucokinase [Phaeosphaeriaceae sp. PMI808]